MDPRRFDALVRSLPASGTRRATLSALASIGLGWVLRPQPARAATCCPYPDGTQGRCCGNEDFPGECCGFECFVPNGDSFCGDVAYGLICSHARHDVGCVDHCCDKGLICVAGNCRLPPPPPCDGTPCGNECCPAGQICDPALGCTTP